MKLSDILSFDARKKMYSLSNCLKKKESSKKPVSKPKNKQEQLDYAKMMQAPAYRRGKGGAIKQTRH